MNAHPTQSVFRRARRKAAMVFAGALAVPLLLAGCSDDSSDSPADGATDGATDSETPASGTFDSLTVALPSSVSSLDVSREAGIVNYTIALLAQESLLGIDADGQLVPALAESWDAPDASTYVLQIRDGVTFSDGTDLTVDDVIASINVHAEEGSTSALAYAYAGVESVEATGEREITIRLTEPNSAFPWILSPGTLQITSDEFIEANKDTIGTPETLLLGTGPYKITEFVPDSHVALEANTEWWNGEPKASSVRLDFIADEGTRQLALRDGSVDMAMNVPVQQVDEWAALEGVEVEAATDNSLVTLAFNTQAEPFSDENVRAAVSHAIDREGIVNSLLGGQGEVATTIPSPAQWGGLLDENATTDLYGSITQYDFDMDKARELLADSAFADGFSTEVAYPNSGPQVGRALLTLAENLKQLNIDLKVNEVTLEQWIAELGNHAPMSVGWYFPTTGDPSEYVQLLLHSKYAAQGGTNLAEYSNPEVDALLDQEIQAVDPAERGRLIGEALTAAAEDVAYQPLWWGQAATAFGEGVGTDQFGPYFYVGPWVELLSPR